MSKVFLSGAGLGVLNEQIYESQVECLFFYDRENCSKAQLPCRAMSGMLSSSSRCFVRRG